MRRRLGALTGALLLATALAAVPSARAAAPEPVRVLVVGDSVAQGSAGDWTWRYRVWRHLRDVGVDVDLVGPHDDLYDNVTGQQGSTAYADPAFDRDHAARWGTGLDDPGRSVADLVAAYRPDVVIESRGINDLMWQDASASSLLDAAAAEVEAVRAVDPGIDVVLTRLPQVWWDERGADGGVRAFNDGLGVLAGSLDTPGSRVVATDSGSGFVEGEDTWDPGHLSARGEVRMSAHVADALAAVGVGAPYPRPLPVVANGHWSPATLAAQVRPGGATLRWSSAPGVTQERIWWRDRTAGGPWRLLDAIAGARLRVRDLRGGHSYAFRLQAVKGMIAADGFSVVAEVVPSVRPARPSGVRARVHGQVVRLRWRAVPRATSYVVEHRASSGWRPAGRRTGRTLTVRRLEPGVHRWRVRARDGRLLGPWSKVVRVRVS